LVETKRFQMLGETLRGDAPRRRLGMVWVSFFMLFY
jgi:hypothetical protein